MKLRKHRRRRRRLEQSLVFFKRLFSFAIFLGGSVGNNEGLAFVEKRNMKNDFVNQQKLSENCRHRVLGYYLKSYIV